MNTPLKNAAAAMGRKGGKAGTGKAKARTSDQARKAALVRWSKPRMTAKEKADALEAFRAMSVSDRVKTLLAMKSKTP